MPHCGCAMLLPSFKNPHRRQISANGNGFRVVRQIGHFRQHRTIPALRLKHRSGSCGTASALPKCSIMSGCGTRIALRGQKPLAFCDRCPCFGSLFPPLAALTFAASSIICAFGLASAAPRPPYRHLELCGIALKIIRIYVRLPAWSGSPRPTPQIYHSPQISNLSPSPIPNFSFLIPN